MFIQIAAATPNCTSGHPLCPTPQKSTCVMFANSPSVGKTPRPTFPPTARRSSSSPRVSVKCDQIFTMNVDGSNQHMVSTGKGRTTC